MSMSNRARRMAAHHVRHRADAHLNLIPLIDILSAMVAFLLVYSSQVQVIQNSKGIQIPESVARRSPHPSVVVMVTQTDLFVQGARVASVEQVREAKGDVITALRAALERANPGGGARTLQGRGSRREVTIMADKTLPYAVLKKVIATCTGADYGRVALAVLEKAEPLKGGPLTAS
jgi:biopolymer transport protein TolR